MTQISAPSRVIESLTASPLAVLAPGQGSQRPGMLMPWLSPDIESLLESWSNACGLNLLQLGTTATATEIVDTAITQPLIVATSLAAFHTIETTEILTADTIVAGHSVGELTAAVVAGVLRAEDAIVLAAVRGRAMAQACALAPTGMAAVVGGEFDAVSARIGELGLILANRNGTGQIVVAGPTEVLKELTTAPPKGAKVIALQVAGAFHTEFMAPARDDLAAAAADIVPADPIRPLLSNADGHPVLSGRDALDKIVAQLTAPVRWDLCMATLGAAAVCAAVELPPASTLSGILRRELPDIARYPLKAPANIAAVAAEYTAPPGDHVTI